MFAEYFNLTGFGWDLSFHSYPFSNIAWGLIIGGILIFGGYHLARTKGAVILLLGGAIVFALMKGVLPL